VCGVQEGGNGGKGRGGGGGIDLNPSLPQSGQHPLSSSRRRLIGWDGPGCSRVAAPDRPPDMCVPVALLAEPYNLSINGGRADGSVAGVDDSIRHNNEA